MLKVAIPGLSTATSHTLSVAMLAMSAFSPLVVEHAPEVRASYAAQTEQSRLLREVAQRHLKKAAEKSERAIEERLEALTTFFDQPKKNCHAFAQEALSWDSKWRYIVDRLPFTAGGRHDQFLHEAFAKHFFRTSQLEEEVRRVVRQYLDEVRSIERAMLVDLRVDAPRLIPGYTLAQINHDKAQAVFDEALTHVTSAAGGSVAADAALEIAALITGQILTQVAARLAVSGGVLGTGALSAWATMGVGLVVGLALDQIISGVWNAWTDPEGTLAGDLQKKLEDISSLIVDGSKDVEGLRSRLQKVEADRAIPRSKAVLALLEPQSAWSFGSLCQPCEMFLHRLQTQVGGGK